MPRFYARLSFILLPLFGLLAIMMSALGSTQPIHPALRGFVEGCEGIPQPCWYGIVPGVTDWQMAVEIITNMGYEINPYLRDIPFVEGGLLLFTNGTCTVTLLLMNPLTVEYSCPNLQLGEVLEFTGFPINVGICNSLTGAVGGPMYCVSDYLFFKNGITVSTSSEMIFATVYQVRFSTPSDSIILHGWRGFIPHRLYCRLEHIEDQFCDYGSLP